MQNRILVTGGSGQLAREMLKLDRDLLAPSRKEMDISSYDSIESYCASRGVSIVIHAAAVTNKFNEDADEGYLLSNIIGTANVALWCRRHKTRLVYVSSDYVYPGERGGYSEESPLLPVNRYAVSKLGGECSVHLVAKSLIVRTSFYRELNFAEGCTD
ncbi:MAG TPA: sugar nucleotide-binding protein, partial [Bacteroidota bacterium]